MPEPARKTTRDAVRDKARALITESWQSQANLSFFLVLLVVVAFVLPSLGFGRTDVQVYSDIAFSLLLISGVAIAWGRRKLFLPAVVVGSAALAVRWMAFFTPTPTLQLWADEWTLAATLVIAIVLLLQVFRQLARSLTAHPGRNRGLPAVRNGLGKRLPNYRSFAPRVFQCRSRHHNIECQRLGLLQLRDSQHGWLRGHHTGATDRALTVCRGGSDRAVLPSHYDREAGSDGSRVVAVENKRKFGIKNYIHINKESK